MRALPQETAEIESYGQNLIVKYHQYQTDKLINIIFGLCGIMGLLIGLLYVNYYEMGAAGVLLLSTLGMGRFNYYRRRHDEIVLGRQLYHAELRTKKLSAATIKSIYKHYWQTRAVFPARTE